MLNNDVVTPSSSPWASPVVLVKKKDGSFRFCVDYRRINKITKKDVYPLPRIDDAFDRLQDASFFSSIDLASGYWQVEVDEQDREKTAFITPDGLYEFKVMPFGLCNAPSTFQRMIDLVLGGLKWSACLVYLDDVIVFSTTFEEHLRRLEAVLTTIEKAGLTLRPSKCKFASRRLKFLGHLVDANGVSPDPDKVKAVAQFPTPQNVKQLRSFLGLCGYYRRFVRHFSRVAQPLTALTKKGVSFVWSPQCSEAFDALKNALTSAPVLAHYSDTAPTSIHTDASGYGIGAVLTQEQPDGRERVVAYASRSLSKAERNYSTTERECLAVVWATSKFRPYLYGRPFTVVTDHHALCWLTNLRDPNGRLARWALRLQEFDITVTYKSGRKHRDADCLSRAPIDTPTPSDEDDDAYILPIAATSIRDAQRRDPAILRLLDVIDDNPEDYRIENGVLLKKNRRPTGRQWLVVLPKELFPVALADLHDDPTAGHLGLHRTWERVRQRFYAPRLYSFVRRYVTSCRACQRRKQPTQRPAGLLQPIPPTSFPFQRIGIDLLGRFPVSRKGNRWIIVCTDYFSRYAETKAVPAGTAEEIAEFLLSSIILRHGAPQELLSDRGQSFLSHIVRRLEEDYNITRRLTTAYHPQTNGLTERFNRTLADMISMYVDDEHRNWDEILPYVTFAYNTSRQDTTGFSPFFLVHGREAATPLDAMLPDDAMETTADDYAAHLSENIDEVRETVHERTVASQTRAKQLYDSRHRSADYSPGDLVWIWKPYRRVGRAEKLLHHYFGPYRVLRQTSAVNYEVEPAEDEEDASTSRRRRRTVPEIVHVSRMKPYVARHPEDDVRGTPSAEQDTDSPDDAPLVADNAERSQEIAAHDQQEAAADSYSPSSRQQHIDDNPAFRIVVPHSIPASPPRSSRPPAPPARSPYLLRSRVRL